MNKFNKDKASLRPHKLNSPKRNDGGNSIVPFSIRFEGSIAESLARILRAVCRLIEEAIDSVICFLHKKGQK